VISQEIINELWRSGFTIARRLPDPTDIPHKEIPYSRSYQWMHLEHDKIHIGSGWAPVPNERHPGRFAPWGTEGQITWNGLGLFEKPTFEVEAEQAASHAKAHQNSQDALGKMERIVKEAGYELIGAVATVGENTHTNTVTKTIDTTIRIPKDMQPHVLAIMAERDRLGEAHIQDSLEVAAISQKFHEHMKANPNDPMWPTLHAFMMPKAIENVRARLASSQEA